MKYSPIELEILKTKGKKALLAYRKANRIAIGRTPNRVIESRKYKQKYKEKFDENA